MKLPGKTILLVEDEAIVALTEKRWLKGEGFNVIHAVSGISAIDAVKKDPESIDLILMDIDLGYGMDGTEAAREILKQHDIPLLFLSSHTEKEVVDKTEEITSYGYVVKGSDETVLLASIKMAFKLFQQKRETLIQETKLFETAENLAITLESIGDGVITTDRNGYITRMNQVSEHLCGWTFEEANGRPLCEVFNIINAKTRQKADNPVDRVIESGKKAGLANHMVLVSKDGSEYNIFDSAAPIRNKGGKILGVVLVFSDVSEKYKKDEQLRDNEELLRFALEGTNDGLWDVNMKTGEVYLSPRGCEILGYRPDGLPEAARVWSDLVYEDDLPETKRRLEKYLSGQSPLFEVEQRIKTKSGELKWIHTRGKAVSFDDDGMPVRMTGTHTDISERKKAEEELIKSEERFRSLVENAPIPLTISRQGYTIYSNSIFANMLGFSSAGEMVGKHFTELIAPEEKDRAMDIVQKRETGEGAPRSYEILALKKNGVKVPIYIQTSRVLLPEGMTTIAAFTDLTEHYNLNRALRESEEHFKDLFENAPLGYQSLDEDGCFIDVNQTWLEIMGYERDEVVGRWFGDFLVPQMVDLFRESFPKIKATGRVHTEFEMIRKDGTTANIVFDGRISHTTNGKFKQTHCILKDVTGVRKAERNISGIEERHKLLYENSMDGILFASPDGFIISANPAACRLFGMTEEEIIKKGRNGLVDLTDPRHMEAAKERTKSGRFAGELDWIKRDGTKFTGEVSSVIFNNSENQKRTCTIIRDVTVRKLAEEQMKKNNEELVKLNTVKDKSLAIISHDLRGPFQGFLGLTKDLASNIEKMEQEEIAEIASVMHQSAKETYSLLTNLHEWSRLQTGRFSFNPVELNLFLEVANLQRLFQSALVLKAIMLENDVDKDVIIKTDENALSTILRNLIDNAIKFTHEGGKVSVSSIKKGSFLEVTVHDSGVGIGSDKLEVLLGPYAGYTTRGTNGEKGSGLGFQLCKDLVEKCGGTIRVKSAVNSGTEFSFTLPA